MWEFGNQDTDASEVVPCFVANFDKGEFDYNTDWLFSGGEDSTL